jgi:hypothetical protein
MKSRAGISLLFLFAAGAAVARVEPPLPTWAEEERAKMVEDGWMAGGLLLNLEAIPEEDAPGPPSVIEDPTPDELASAPEDEREVAEEYLVEYFESKPEGCLVDPQGLLATRERSDLEAFLEHHGGDSRIDLYVYIFGEDQRIPGEVREEEIVERLYSVGKPAVVIYYYLGAPQRSELYLSPVVTDTVSAADQRRALESSVMRAFGSTRPAEQLEAFLVQMSIRIYWMERMTEGTAVETMESIPDGEELRAFPAKRAAKEEKVEIRSWMKLVGALVAAGFGGSLALWSAVMWWRGRVRLRFPELEVEPRLGGGHAAGIGAVISFGSSAIPPAMQRKQVPDYMRRA